MLLQVFGNSPDETANCRLYLNRENTTEALTMIQPQLMAFAMGESAPYSSPVRKPPLASLCSFSDESSGIPSLHLP